MKRDQYKTVTDKESFAILIPASPEEAIGEATFQMELGGPQPVRAVTYQELIKESTKMKEVDRHRFFALVGLRDALQAGDALMLGNAEERLEKTYRLRETQRPRWADPELDRKIGEAFAPSVGLSPEETIKYIEGLRSGPGARENPSRLLSYEVSQELGRWNAQIVLWWAEGSFRPAIYCSDKKTALYLHTFFIAPNGGLGWRICPYSHCKKQEFFQDRPNQDYCCPAHREAHRVARWRNEKKLRAEEKKRRKNVTKKKR